GYAAERAFTTVGSAGATGELTITLHKGQPVAGRVIDDAGKPIAGVRITASGGSGDGDGEADATTDAAGEFTIAALTSGTHRLRATDGEHAPATSAPITVADRPVTKIEIVMTGGGTLAGTVVDTQRKPVAFAIVRVASTGSESWQGQARQATSDARGAFELRGLPRTKLQARAESDTAASKVVDVDLGETARRGGLTLVLDVTGTISGVVVDNTGQPVPEVQVNAFPDVTGGASIEGLALAGMSSVTTGGGGEFVIQGLPDGVYRLWAARSSAQTSGWGSVGTTARTGDQGVRLTLAASGSLIGTLVLAGSGAAPALASVSIGYQPATPAPGGVFQIKELEPRSYDVTFRGPEFAELIKHDVRIEAGKVTDLGVVTVARGRRVTGKVIDRAGAVVPGAKIKVGQMLYSSADAGNALDSFESMAGVRSTLSDQNGAFVLGGLPATATQIIAEHADRGQSIAVAVPAGESDLPPVTLELRGFGSIAGRVTQRGKPLAATTISTSTKGGGAQGQLTTTGSDGAFLLGKVPEGTHVVSAMQSSLMSLKSASVTVQVTAGKQATANIVVAVGEVTLTVQVRAKPGNQVDAAQVFLFAGQVTLSNAKELVDSALQSSLQGSTLWFGAGKPAPTFAELVAGEYSICALPITGSLNDPQFQQRLQEHLASLKVYCRAARVTAAPLAQSFDVELPAMTPLPSAP
ncbi:MAG: carboxypeptidase regulatory-like domain-containing protein, partial [Myxococcales bacterium]|nr:carboxypeptidase regulatory-like domain-containing protein [Myxococcales bacterium]